MSHTRSYLPLSRKQPYAACGCRYRFFGLYIFCARSQGQLVYCNLYIIVARLSLPFTQTRVSFRSIVCTSLRLSRIISSMRSYTSSRMPTTIPCCLWCVYGIVGKYAACVYFHCPRQRDSSGISSIMLSPPQSRSRPFLWKHGGVEVKVPEVLLVARGSPVIYMPGISFSIRSFRGC